MSRGCVGQRGLERASTAAAGASPDEPDDSATAPFRVSRVFSFSFSSRSACEAGEAGGCELPRPVRLARLPFPATRLRRRFQRLQLRVQRRVLAVQRGGTVPKTASLRRGADMRLSPCTSLVGTSGARTGRRAPLQAAGRAEHAGPLGWWPGAGGRARTGARYRRAGRAPPDLAAQRVPRAAARGAARRAALGARSTGLQYAIPKATGRRLGCDATFFATTFRARARHFLDSSRALRPERMAGREEVESAPAEAARKARVAATLLGSGRRAGPDAEQQRLRSALLAASFGGQAEEVAPRELPSC